MKRPQTIDEKLALAKEVAEQIKEKNGEVDLVFECTGQESCVQAAIYVRLSFFPHPNKNCKLWLTYQP